MNDTTQSCSLSASKPDALFLFGAYCFFFAPLLLALRRSWPNTHVPGAKPPMRFSQGNSSRSSRAQRRPVRACAEIYAYRRCGRFLSLVSARRFQGRALTPPAAPLQRSSALKAARQASPPSFSSLPISSRKQLPSTPKACFMLATSPDGKVYRVSASGEKTVFFDPKSKYIWDLAFGADGTLFVANRR